jgi:hypothetical protein
MKTIAYRVVWLASWGLWIVATVIALPSLLGIHIAAALGDLADELWEMRL